MGRILFVGLISVSSMIIYDLNIKRVAFLEAKTDAPLIVDADAPLTFAVATQGFQSVAGRHAKIVERMGVLDHLQLALGDSCKCLEPPWALPLEQRLGVLATEGFDH